MSKGKTKKVVVRGDSSPRSNPVAVRKVIPKYIPDPCLEDAVRGAVPNGKLKDALLLLETPEGIFSATGCTSYSEKGEVKVVRLPRGIGAYSAGVRGHETRHATVDKGISTTGLTRTKYYAKQVISDCQNELTPLPACVTLSYCRDNLVRGLIDVRRVTQQQRKRTGKPDARERNADLLTALRALAISVSYTGGPYSAKTEMTGYRIAERLEKLVGDETLQALQGILEHIQRGDVHTAYKILVALLESESDLAEPPNDAPMRIEKMESVEGLMPEETGSLAMRIIVLKPMGAKTVREKEISARYSPDGVMLNPTRYLHALLTGDANGLFLRRRKILPGGVVLIDASGSMGVEAETLNKLCAMIPTATVAFYCGHDGGRSGHLCIYAHNRKRFSGTSKQLSRFLIGGNAVDLPALRWLLKMPGPRYIVTDLGYCGGAKGDALASHLLTESAERKGQLRVIYSIKDAMDYFALPEALRPLPHTKTCGCKHCTNRAALRRGAAHESL